MRYMRILERLVGKQCFANVTLTTTYWGVSDEHQPGRAELHEKELIQTEDFWGLMVKHGSEVVRIPESRWLARELLVRLADKGTMTLQAQEELARGVTFDQLAAAKVLNKVS